MMRTLIGMMVVSSLLIVAGCNAANSGTTGPRGPIPNQPEPGSPAAQMQR